MTQIPLGEESNTGASTATDACGDVTTLARLTIHVKENNIAYLVGMLIMYQTGIMDNVFTYGQGLC